MQILIQGADRQVNAIEVPNFEYLPLFYHFPKELLEHGASYLIDLPRNPARILKDKKWLDIVTGDAFLSVVLDGAAFLVWPAFEVKANLESFSGYDPLWKMARAIGLWAEALNTIVNPKLLELLLQHPNQKMPWIPSEYATRLFPMIAAIAIKKHDLRPMIDAVKEIRCIEDYDARPSRAKIDFTRQWYHSRTKHPIVSLDTMIADDDTLSTSDRLDALLHLEDQPDTMEERVCSKLNMEAFIETLSEQEKEILTQRLAGRTQAEIAERLGYKTHSAVTKRLSSIKAKYEAFTNNSI